MSTLCPRAQLQQGTAGRAAPSPLSNQEGRFARRVRAGAAAAAPHTTLGLQCLCRRPALKASASGQTPTRLPLWPWMPPSPAAPAPPSDLGRARRWSSGGKGSSRASSRASWMWASKWLCPRRCGACPAKSGGGSNLSSSFWQSWSASQQSAPSWQLGRKAGLVLAGGRQQPLQHPGKPARSAALAHLPLQAVASTPPTALTVPHAKGQRTKAPFRQQQLWAELPQARQLLAAAAGRAPTGRVGQTGNRRSKVKILDLHFALVGDGMREVSSVGNSQQQLTTNGMHSNNGGSGDNRTSRGREERQHSKQASRQAG